MQLETHNIKGTPQEYETYSMPSKSDFDFWESVTDVVCPSCGQGMILWNEAGYVPGYRTCDHCHNDFMAKGNAQNPKLVKIGKNVHWK
jgi:uncharacterized protein (DUF983 family)